MLCFRNFPAAKNFMDIRAVVKIFRRKFFVSQCRKVWQGNPFVLSFRKLPVSKKFMHRRGGGYHDFPSKVSCTTMPKTLAREPFCVVFQKTSGSKKDFG